MKNLFVVILAMILISPIALACKQDPFMGSITDFDALLKFLAVEDKPRFTSHPPIRGIYTVGLNLIAVEAGNTKTDCKVLVFAIKREASCERSFEPATLKKSYECKL